MALELVDLDRQGTRMKIIFVRHGEPDYRELEARSYTGFGIDLAPLSEKGRQQAQKPVSYTHLTLPTIHVECRSRWSPYH